ncbi:MAG: class I SAM-dependent methyltransferase [Pseudomonadota bacterium]|nr:class I SAM-dependent methyltransferase [Pseudomonadota bacterium]
MTVAAADAPQKPAAGIKPRIATNDPYKDQVQDQWNEDACGSHYVEKAAEGTLEWYLEAEQYRYGVYAPWMAETMEFAKHRGEKVLEVGAGMGTDLAQFAKNGAVVTDLDLSAGHLEHAQRNFRLRGLAGEFRHGDGENLPFDADTFDVVYSNGVIHHTPDTIGVVRDMLRVLKPGGKAIIMVYAENSWHYFREQVLRIGVEKGELDRHSMGWIMSGSVEKSTKGQRPLVKVYTRRRLRTMFETAGFERISICQRQMVKGELPKLLSWIPVSLAGRFVGWNLILKAYKPRS